MRGRLLGFSGLLRVTSFLGVVGLALLTWTAGCARPAGALFEPLAEPRVWPSAPEQPRIMLVGAVASSDDLRAGRSSTEGLGEALRGPRESIRFGTPHAVAKLGGLLAVADVGLGAVHVLDLDARTHVLVNGWSDERFVAPVGVCWLKKRLFVADAGRHEIVELTTAGDFVRRFGADDLKRPVGIAAEASRQQLYVVDGGAHCIAVLSPSGEVLGRIGQPGGEPGEFNYPTHIAVGETQIAVADSANFRVQIFDLDGTFRRIVGSKGDAAGNFALPKGVAFDSAGHLYVVDARFENVQIFDAQGRVLLAFGAEGDQMGYFSLPAGLAIDQNDRIWVADSANARIQVFDYLRDAS